jgi:hypothetical protein
MGLSIEGKDVSKGFQGPSKHGKKKGEPNMYEIFHTQRGGAQPILTPFYQRWSEQLAM